MIEEADFEVSVTVTFTKVVRFAPTERETPITDADALENFYGSGLSEVLESGEYECSVDSSSINVSTCPHPGGFRAESGEWECSRCGHLFASYEAWGAETGNGAAVAAVTAAILDVDTTPQHGPSSGSARPKVGREATDPTQR